MAALDAKDIRRTMPRFAPGAFAANLKLLAGFNALALAWLLVRGDDVMAQAEALISRQAVVGERHHAQAAGEVDTEAF